MRVAPSTRRVRVWFGEHVVADYAAEPDRAAQYEEAMQRRYAGLRVTNELLPLTRLSGPPPALPGERLWELTP